MINFLRDHYKRIGAAKDELERTEIETERFRYHDSLSKEERQKVWQLDRAVRREVADEIAASLQEMKRHVTM